MLDKTRNKLNVLEETREQFLHSSRTPLREGTREEVGKEARPTEDSSGIRSSGHQRTENTMSQKKKLPKSTGDRKEDPVRHCRSCETIWTTHSVTDMDKWLNQFPTGVWGVVVDWFSDMDKAKITTKQNFDCYWTTMRLSWRSKTVNKEKRKPFEPTIEGSRIFLAGWVLNL